MGGSSEVAYSLSLLRHLGDDLTGLVQALDGKAAQVHYDDASTGHRLVTDALHHFDDSWDDHREELTKHLTALSDMAHKAADTFEKVDKDLAHKIREAVESAR